MSVIGSVDTTADPLEDTTSTTQINLTENWPLQVEHRRYSDHFDLTGAPRQWGIGQESSDDGPPFRNTENSTRLARPVGYRHIGRQRLSFRIRAVLVISSQQGLVGTLAT